MHLLAAQPGTITDGIGAVDLGQTPGEIVVLSAADSEIACLAAAQRNLAATATGWPSLRLANLMRLGHNYSVDLYVDQVAAHARLIIARVLGGRGYWPYGIDRLAALARERGIALALLPGDERPDPELAELATMPPEAVQRLWRYLAEGGPGNAEHFLRYAADLAGRSETHWREPAPLLRAGLHWPGLALPSLADIRERWRDGAPTAAIIFYRALVQAANAAPIDALVVALQARSINPLPVFVQSLKDPQAVAILDDILAAAPPGIVLNGTGFAVSAPGAARSETPFDRFDCPVLQIVLAGSSEDAWRKGARGLDSRDIAMNIALPEVDGRVIARAISFKSGAERDPLTEADLVAYKPVADRVAFVADLARNWLRLRETSPEDRRVA
ncbi:MAG: cobaltochelatase subunit CobN, partial [Alphaproteobacteria bacterium]|nr:cobaltochelatase subunit CobN [Alphaproteobacteria bacterium]